MRFIPNAVTRKAAMAVLKTQKHSPKILFAAGVVGVVSAAVLAARATLRLDEIVDEAKETLEAFETVKGNPEYTEEDQIKDKALFYVQTSIKVIKLYAPAVGLGVASIGMLAGSHRILTKRNLALTGAYSALEKGFKEYRRRVVEDLGEDRDREFLHGTEIVHETHVDQDGKKTKVETKIAAGISPYGIMFRQDNPNWNRQPEYNFLFLRAQQRYLNDKLQVRGHILLNDVYDAIGVQRTPAGCVVGWLSKEYGGKDGYVDFGIFDDADALRVYDYMTGHEGELYLDFNVDGNIFEKI